MSSEERDMKPVESVSSAGVMGGTRCVFWGAVEEGLHVKSNAIIFISFTETVISANRDRLIGQLFISIIFRKRLFNFGNPREKILS